jgi:DNA-binding response OmpR family regulator
MRILLVEDEIKLGRAIKRALELQSYVVDYASSGESGLDLALSEAYDLMILDWMLPQIEGTQICRQVRAQKISAPILILTAKSQIQDKVFSLDLGADDYLVKPFSMEELFARVRALLRRSSQTSNSDLSIGDLVLNPQSFKVWREDHEIILSAKEYAILEYLMRHPSTILTKKQIIDHVWNYDTDVLEGTVEVHIKHLRDKIDSGYKQTLIQTHRGFGYEIRESL